MYAVEFKERAAEAQRIKEMAAKVGNAFHLLWTVRTDTSRGEKRKNVAGAALSFFLKGCEVEVVLFVLGSGVLPKSVGGSIEGAIAF